MAFGAFPGTLETPSTTKLPTTRMKMEANTVRFMQGSSVTANELDTSEMDFWCPLAAALRFNHVGRLKSKRRKRHFVGSSGQASFDPECTIPVSRHSARSCGVSA